MTWADDVFAFDLSAEELAAVVRAHVLDGEELTVEIEDRNARAFGIDEPMLAGTDLVRRTDVDPVAHGNGAQDGGQTGTISSSGSTVRTRPSMPERVAESELGQLPQAPW